MPIITEASKIDNTPAAGLRAQLSPQRLRNEKQDDSFAQTEPNRNLLAGDKLITNEKECQECKSDDKSSESSQHTALDSVKQGISAIPGMASNAAHQTAEFVKHIPEHAQQGAHATAEFVKGIHVPESVQHGLSATSEFVQHGAHATSEFVRNLPENMQHGAHATAEFVKHLPEQAKEALHIGAKANDANLNQKEASNLGCNPAESGVPADDKFLQRAAPPASPYEYKTPTSLEKRDYLQTMDRSDAEGMHVHRACGAVKHGVHTAGSAECAGVKSP